MRSLLSSYFSRLKPIEDIATFEEEAEEDGIRENKSSKKKANKIRSYQSEELKKLKYIDDSDSLDSAHNLIDESSDSREEMNYDRFNGQIKHEKTMQASETLNIQNLIAVQSKSDKEGKKSFT